MLDSGADVNLIKENLVRPSVQINQYNTLRLQGISPNPVSTSGTVNILLLGKQTEFHLIPNNAPFTQDGILGIEFLKMHNAVLDFKHRQLLCDDANVPFFESEHVLLKPRSVTPFHILISNPEIKTGYVPLHKTVNGVYFGEAIVTNIGGKAHLPIFNTSERAYKMEIPSMTLQEFDTIDTLGPSNPMGAAEAADGRCVNVQTVSLLSEPLDLIKTDASFQAAAYYSEVNSPTEVQVRPVVLVILERFCQPMVIVVTSLPPILILLPIATVPT